MSNFPSDSFSVSAVMLKQPSQHRWASSVWSLVGVLPGLDKITIDEAASKGELSFLTDVKLRLFRQFCESYYVNLTSKLPKIYLVCRQGETQLMPVLLTVDFDEAAAYMEAGDQVYDAPLPDELCVWLERFVLAHYQPEAPKKRRRKRWLQTEEEKPHE